MLNKLDLGVYLLIAGTFLAIYLNDDRIVFLETEWFQSYWTISIPIALTYIILVLLEQGQLVKRTGPVEHRKLLKYWNFTLATFSILGACRVGSEFVQTFAKGGLFATFCNDDYFHTRSVYFWYFLFVISKSFEMGDTAFLIAARKPVRFIHWFHHAATMIYSFYIAAYLPAIGRWMSSMNFVVHSLMYSYYFLAAYRIKVPRKIAMLITTLQTAQMFIGLTINTMAFFTKQLGHSCGNGGYTVEAGILMYISYVILFVKLFRSEISRKMV